jgi:hypothetical protein
LAQRWSTQLAKKAGARVAAGLGFALLGLGFAVRATMSANSGDGRAAAWLTIAGVGVGFVMPTAMDDALPVFRTSTAGWAPR